MPVIFMKATSAICGPNDDVLIPRGKVTGGSSAINGQVFLRGVPEGVLHELPDGGGVADALGDLRPGADETVVLDNHWVCLQRLQQRQALGRGVEHDDRVDVIGP